jgi:tRNA (guanine37-N1)-methyltransferase
MFAPVIGLSILGRAVESGILDVRFHNPLDALDANERADDTPYGGGAGMVIRLEPLTRILDAILAECPLSERSAMLMMSPAGAQFVQNTAKRFAALDHLIFLCGHYEGIDDRIVALYPFEEVSLGDFVLTGGEIAAMAILDATARLLEGAVRADSLVSESFENGMLDYPSYTRPPRFRGVDVPAVLLSGNHAAIAAWRREQSRERTRQRRPDL